MSMGDDSVFASDIEPPSDVQHKRNLLLELRAASSEPTDDESAVHDYLSMHRGSISAAIEMLSLFTDDSPALLPPRAAAATAAAATVAATAMAAEGGGDKEERERRRRDDTGLAEDRISLHGADYTDIIPAMLKDLEDACPDGSAAGRRGQRDAGDGAEDPDRVETSLSPLGATVVAKSLSDPCVPMRRSSRGSLTADDDAAAADAVVTSPTPHGSVASAKGSEWPAGQTGWLEPPVAVERPDSGSSIDEFLLLETQVAQDELEDPAAGQLTARVGDPTEAEEGQPMEEVAVLEGEAAARERNVSVCSVLSEDDPALFLRQMLTKGRQDSLASVSSDASGVRVLEVTSPMSPLAEHAGPYHVEEPETTDADDSDDSGELTPAADDDEDECDPPAEDEDAFPSILSPISERSEPGSSESRTPSPEELRQAAPAGKPRRGYNASQALHGAMRSLLDKLKMPRWSAVERLAALPPPAAHQRALAATLAVSEYSPRPSIGSSSDESDETLGERVVEGSEGGEAVCASRSAQEKLAAPAERARLRSTDLETHELEGARRAAGERAALPLRRSCSVEELDELNEFLELEQQVMSETERQDCS
ncbi:uncharacterized protein LOC119109556 [Pollicipes pollicipes]|uniref:uncharacterized protein LOC119109556 n=1 Tax=Pollicipes pollicipes TaxID=41117 RepID=UPI00188515EE|nr:uncharacterized protein LOC119109556 [Pollicipes pollicipes]